MLLQEKYWEGDPWRLLVICILLNRTRGSVAEPVIVEFFRRWPTARTCSHVQDIESVIEWLGLGHVRAVYLNKLSIEYAELQRRGVDPSDIDPMRFPGCGQYAKEAWMMFFLGQRDFWPVDKELNKRMKELRA